MHYFQQSKLHKTWHLDNFEIRIHLTINGVSQSPLVRQAFAPQLPLPALAQTLKVLVSKREEQISVDWNQTPREHRGALFQPLRTKWLQEMGEESVNQTKLAKCTKQE